MWNIIDIQFLVIASKLKILVYDKWQLHETSQKKKNHGEEDNE